MIKFSVIQYYDDEMQTINVDSSRVFTSNVKASVDGIKIQKSSPSITWHGLNLDRSR